MFYKNEDEALQLRGGYSEAEKIERTDFSESFNIVMNDFYKTRSVHSESELLSEALQPHLDQIELVTGKKIKNFGDAYRPGDTAYEDLTKLTWTSELKKGAGSNKDQFLVELAKLNKFIQNEPRLKGYQLLTPKFLDQETRRIAEESSQRRDNIMQRKGSGLGSFTAMAVGELRDIAISPIQAPIAVLGGIPGILSVSAFLKVMAQQGAYSGALVASTRPRIQQIRQGLDLEYSNEEMAYEIGAGAIGGAVFGAGLNALIPAVKGIKGSLFPKKNWTTPKIETEELGTVNENLVDHVIAKAETEKSFIDDNPFIETPNSQSDHINKINNVTEALEEKPNVTIESDGNNIPIKQKTADEITRETRPLHSVPDATIEIVDPRNIKVDAKRFQFKSGGDQFGVTDRLKGVTKWNPEFSGTVIIFKDKNKNMFIADGHQRVALAKRILAQNDGQKPEVVAHIFDEATGITAKEVMIRASLKNIAEGTGSPVDVARILKIDPKRIGDLPPRSELAKQGSNLSNLKEEPFNMMVNESIPFNYGALVGKLINDEQQQVATINLLRELNPTNEIQAEQIIRQTLEMGFTKETQETLFGTEQLAKTLFKERAEVLDKAIKELSQEKKIFSTLNKNMDNIETEGNILKKENNIKKEIENGQGIEIIKRLANRTGAIGDALTNSAKNLQEGQKIGKVVEEFNGIVRREIANGNIGRDAVGGIRSDASIKTENTNGAELESSLKGFEEPRGKAVELQADRLENDLLEELNLNPKEAFQEDIELRQNLKQKMDEGLNNPDDIEKHPAIQKAYEEASKIKETNLAEGYLSDDWIANREFNFGEEKIIGFEKAVNKFYNDFKTLAYGKNTLVPDEPVLKEKKAYIVIGAPASGKSTIADKIARNKKAMIIDSDEIKKTLPEFNNGVGANAVHLESKAINELVFEKAIKNNDNMLLPRVGHKASDLANIKKELKNNGYSVDLILSDVTPAEAFKRMINRFIDTGRLININYFKSIGLKPQNNYNTIKGDFDGYARINQEGSQGSEEIIEQSIKANYQESNIRLRQSRPDRQATGQDALEKDGTPFLKGSELQSQELKIPIKEEVIDGELKVVPMTQREILQDIKQDKSMIDRLEGCV